METLPGTLAMPVAWIPAGYSEPSTEMLQKPSSSSKSHQIPQAESPYSNGNESSKGKQLTSISSSHCSTMSSLMRSEQVTWETQRSLLGLLNQRRRSQQQQGGPPLGEGLQRPSPLPFPTDVRSFSNIETTSSRNSLRKSHLPITNSSYMTLPSKMESQQVNKPYSSTSSSSAGSTQPLSSGWDWDWRNRMWMPTWKETSISERQQTRDLQQFQCRNLQKLCSQLQIPTSL